MIRRREFAMTRRILLILAVFAAVLMPTAAWAGSPHFIASATSVTISGDTLTATFKEAGLGDEPQVHVVLSATAQCVNPGGNNPKAGNKQTFTAAGDFPVQRGQASGSLTVVAAFQPSCSPPMSVVWSDVILTDTTSGISVNLS
jgi:hypothetical protein